MANFFKILTHLKLQLVLVLSFCGFRGVRWSFGRPNKSNNQDFWLFGGHAFRDLNFGRICWISDKNNGEKHMDVQLLFVLVLVFFVTLETLKIVLASRRELSFYKIAFFVLDEKRHRK